MANAVGKVSLLQGQAFVRGADGSQRALKVGDVVMEGEVIITAPGGHVELALNGGQAFQVREQETVTLDKSVLGVDLPESHAAALLDRLPDTAAITQAIALGSPLDVLLEETAAGLDGGSEGGHSFVQLLRVVEGTSASAPFASAGGLDHALPAVEGGAGLLEVPVQTVPRDTTPPNAPTVELTHDTGASNTDQITNNGALSISGTEPGALVEYSTDGTSWTNSYTPVEGTNTVYVRQTDVAGNVSGSSTLSFTLDTHGPVLGNQAFNYAENQATGAVIGHATATDSSGVAGYQFKWTDGSLHSVSEDGYFGIGADGSLTMTATGAGSVANDFEALANSRDFIVVATDVAGNQSQAVLTFSETNRNDSVPAIGDATVTVSEKGLAGGMLDLVNPANNATIASGTLAVSDADGSLNPLSVSLVAPTAALTSHGQTVVWTGSGTDTLVGSAGGTEVIRISVDNGGAYSVKLEAPIAHSVAGSLDAKTINVGTQVSDGLHVTNGNLAINVLDDAPAVGNLTESIVLPKIDTNVMIVLDVSGSMGNASGIAGQNRLDAAKSAIKGLIDKYDSLGDVSVRVVYFDTNAHEVGTGWVDATTGKTQVSNLSLGSSTNYDAALAQAIAAFGEPGKIAGAQNVCYFLSDGQPNYANGSTSTLTGTLNTSKYDIGIQGAEETSWTNFLNSNGIQTYAIGMGTGLPANATTYLDPVAYDGGAGANTNSTIVTNMAQLSAVLESTVPAPATGNLLTGNTIYGSGIGADGGYIPSMTLDGRTYNYDVTTHNISTSGTSGDSYSYNATTHSLSVNTAQGGVLVVNFDSGDYSYTPSATVAGTVSENLGLSLTDADGDTASGTLTLNISRQGTSITGTAVADTLTGSTGADAIAGGAGSDTLSGLAGADTFKWSLGDQGTPSKPAIDTVTDFDSAINGDKLDLRDLLQGEHATGANADLQNYLHFEKSGSDTIVHVSSSGGFGADSHSVGSGYSSGAEDQRIVLQGANLVGPLTTDQQVIQDLLNKGKLQTD